MPSAACRRYLPSEAAETQPGGTACKFCGQPANKHTSFVSALHEEKVLWFTTATDPVSIMKVQAKVQYWLDRGYVWVPRDNQAHEAGGGSLEPIGDHDMLVRLPWGG